jgi:hypothetical protein
MEAVDPNVLALAMPAVFLVQIGVDILKDAIGPTEHRRWALPLLGVMLGWIVVGAQQVMAGLARTPELVAGVLLAGLVAYALAAGVTAMSTKVRARSRQERVRQVREAGGPLL